MRRGGFREDEPITRYKPCQRELCLQIALPPMTYDRLLDVRAFIILIFNYCILLKFSYNTTQLPFLGNPGASPTAPSQPAAIMATAVNNAPFEGK